MDIINSKILVTGGNGMVGSAIVRALARHGARQVITAVRENLDLTEQAAVRDYLAAQAPDIVVIAAAKVGGIHANNTYPAEFIYQNLMIEANLIDAAYRANCRQLLFLGSSCIYPKLAAQPMTESALLEGPLEPTNEPYAIAKIAGIKLCESYNRQYGTDYRSLMPTNLYGPGDNFHAQDSHVIPALIQRIHHARCRQDDAVTIWGSGTPKREFLHVDDLAAACLHILGLSRAAIDAVTAPMCSHVNVGSGVDVSIREIAELISAVIGYEGKLTFDASKPDGPPRKLLDVAKLQGLGWQPRIDLAAGLAQTYQWFLAHQGQLRQ